jgi:DeoR family fructose operon transcriptional repressor
MNFQERKQIILRVVEERGSTEVKELADMLQTSDITVRRDLAALAAKGLIFRTHGGAMKVELARDPFKFENKAAVNAEKKDYICEIAARQLVDNDIIFIDCGSTLFRLCPLIRNKRIKIITNSIPVVHELMNSQVQINLIGGEIDAERQAVHGSIAVEHICRYRATKAFIGVDGISLKNGLSANSEKEASIAMAMAKQAKQVYLLCDASKFEHDKYLCFAPLSLVHTIITDATAKPEIVEQYRKKGVEVLN